MSAAERCVRALGITGAAPGMMQDASIEHFVAMWGCVCSACSLVEHVPTRGSGVRHGDCASCAMTALDVTPQLPLVIHDIPVANVSMSAAIDEVLGAARSNQPLSVYFANADCVNIAAKNAEYMETLNAPGVRVFADGIGMKIASWIAGKPIVDNVNGTDMFPLLCAQAAQTGAKLYLLGAEDGVAARAARCMEARYPGLRIVGTHHGYFDHEDCPEVLERINQARPDILLVALGAPRQELFIRRHRAALGASVCMAVGGLFDFYSGDKARAPKLLRTLGLEWAWRMGLEPGRLWRRYVLGNPLFLARVLKWQLTARRRQSEGARRALGLPESSLRRGHEAA